MWQQSKGFACNFEGAFAMQPQRMSFSEEPFTVEEKFKFYSDISNHRWEMMSKQSYTTELPAKISNNEWVKEKPKCKQQKWKIHLKEKRKTKQIRSTGRGWWRDQKQALSGC